MSPNERGPFEPALSKPEPATSAIQNGAASAWPHYPRRQDAEMRLDPTARLEWLDDLMFAAIDGDAAALDCAADAWRKTVDDLGASALEESRQQYLRRAQSVWKSLRAEPNHPPHKVFAAIEVISLLANKTR